MGFNSGFKGLNPKDYQLQSDLGLVWEGYFEQSENNENDKKKHVQYSPAPVVCTGTSTLVGTVYNSYDIQQSTTLRLTRIFVLRCTVRNSICPAAAAWCNYRQLIAHSLHSHFTSRAHCVRQMLVHVTLWGLRLAQRCCWTPKSYGM